MAKAYEIVTENLRKKSRELLSKLEENSKILDDEIRKLNYQNPWPKLDEKNGSKTFRVSLKNCWKIRNDSSGVSGVLCPEISGDGFSNPQEILGYRTEGIEEKKKLGMTVGGRILITSKHTGVLSPLRKPIRGCYCNEPKNIQPRSIRTTCKPSLKTCTHCQSNFELHREKSDEQDCLVSPALSCETLRRVQKINYTPRSEFLRRVQKKASEKFDTHHIGYTRQYLDHENYNKNELNRQYGGASYTKAIPEEPRSLRETLKSKKKIERTKVINDKTGTELDKVDETHSLSDDDGGEQIEVPVEVYKTVDSPNEDEITRIHSSLEKNIRKVPSKSTINRRKSSEENQHRKSQSSIGPSARDSSPEIETILPPRTSKTLAKKTITSKNQNQKHAERISDENSQEKDKELSKAKKLIRVLSQKSCCFDDCCLMNKRGKQKALNKSKKCVGCCHCDGRCLSLLQSAISQVEEVDEDAMELRKFREKNYFDTHGSRNTLLSSESSGSLEQFELNDRLFPEPVGRIHRDDLVVSMPACATKQLKRIHYFPRHIVHQEKNEKNPCSKNLCSKKRRHQSCPLTGHAIDLGILKAPRPENSLALKYQKSVI